MKTIKFLSILIFIFAFSQCGSFKFEKKIPFIISSSTYYKLNNNTETNIYIRYSSFTGKGIVEFDSVYFQKKKAKIEIKSRNGLVYIFARLKNVDKNDFILHTDSSMEFNNQIPAIKDFPFELKENEAVISYIIKEKTKYYKIKSIVKEKSTNFK